MGKKKGIMRMNFTEEDIFVLDFLGRGARLLLKNITLVEVVAIYNNESLTGRLNKADENRIRQTLRVQNYETIKI